MANSPDKIPLVTLSRELADFTKKPPVSYRVLYSLCIDGKLPATREHAGWFVERADLPAVARILEPVTTPANRPRVRKAAIPQLASAAV